MRFLKWSDIPKDARIVALPFTHDSITMRLKKDKVEKIIVPPRAERYEDMGDPKVPKMGKIKPTKIELPEVDDLLEKMKKVTAPDLRTIGFTIEEVFTERGKCHVGCRCLPCLQGACGGCHVERHRDDPNRDLVRQLVAEYRG